MENINILYLYLTIFNNLSFNDVFHKIEIKSITNIDRIKFSSMEKNKLSSLPPVSRSIFSIMFPQPQKTMRTNIIERQDAGQSTAAPGPRTPVPVNIGRGRAKYGTARWQYNVFLCLRHPFFKALVQFIKTQSETYASYTFINIHSFIYIY